MRGRTVLVASLLAALGPLALQQGPRAESRAGVEAGSASRATVQVETKDIALLRQQSVRGDAQAQYDLAIALDCGRGARRDPVEAFEWLRKSAAAGHVGAQSALGWKYMTGQGAPRDDGAAFEWLRRAAEKGNTSAQNNLGILYAQGRGVAADPAEAAKWFRLAADKGAAEAQRNLEALRAGRSHAVRPSAEPTLQRL